MFAQFIGRFSNVCPRLLPAVEPPPVGLTADRSRHKQVVRKADPHVWNQPESHNRAAQLPTAGFATLSRTSGLDPLQDHQVASSASCASSGHARETDSERRIDAARRRARGTGTWRGVSGHGVRMPTNAPFFMQRPRWPERRGDARRRWSRDLALPDHAWRNTMISAHAMRRPRAPATPKLRPTGCREHGARDTLR